MPPRPAFPLHLSGRWLSTWPRLPLVRLWRSVCIEIRSAARMRKSVGNKPVTPAFWERPGVWKNMELPRWAGLLGEARRPQLLGLLGSWAGGYIRLVPSMPRVPVGCLSSVHRTRPRHFLPRSLASLPPAL